MLEDTVSPAKATLLSHGQIGQGYAQESNIALRGVMRSGGAGQLLGTILNKQVGKSCANYICGFS